MNICNYIRNLYDVDIFKPLKYVHVRYNKIMITDNAK